MIDNFETDHDEFVGDKGSDGGDDEQNEMWRKCL